MIAILSPCYIRYTHQIRKGYSPFVDLRSSADFSAKTLEEKSETPRKLLFKAILFPFLKLFPFYNAKNRQRMFVIQAVGWTNGLTIV
jgi:hypothetical protein